MRTDRTCLWIILALAVGYGTYLLTPVLTPFVMGALLAYLGDPVADRMEARGMPRTVAVSVVFAFLFALLALVLLLLVPLIQRQLMVLAQKLPGYIEWIQAHLLPELFEALGIDGSTLDLGAIGQSLSGHWGQAGGLLKVILAYAGQSGGLLLTWIADLVLIPVVTFYLLRDWDVVMARIRDLLPRRLEPVVSSLAAESDQVLGAFLRGQLMVMIAQGTIYSIGLWLVGLDFALLIGMLAGLISFVPYLGAIVGILVASVAAFLQFQDLFHVLPVLLVFGVGQTIEGMLLTPLLVGDRIGLHPVAVIFAILVGGHLFGFFGVLVALPVAAVIMVLLRHTHDEYLRSAFYSVAAVPPDEQPPS